MQCKDIPDIEVLEMARQWSEEKNGIGVLEALENAYPDAPPNVLVAKLIRLNDRGLLEYGVSIRYCWLTPEGEAMLRKGRGQP